MTPIPAARQTIKRRPTAAPGAPAPGILSAAAISQTKLRRIVPSHKPRRNQTDALPRLTLRGIPENDGDSSRLVASLIHLFASCREHCD
jgi:hypothetical protein